MSTNKNKLNSNEVELTQDYLKQTVYWIINKFIIDSFHKQYNSSRNDLIGGFLDRWVNKIPEFLIFDKLLENKPYDPVTDFFLYDQETAKNAPDILGLKDNNGVYYPFTKFKNNRWDTPEDMPFVEMKVFRENHKLITIPARQFKPNRYYAIVVSHLSDDYILSLFDSSFFNRKYLDKLSKIDDFIGLDQGNQLLDPKILEKNKLGTYELLGIYKWETIKDHCIKVGLKNKKPEKPIYLKNIEEYVPDNVFKLNSGYYDHFYKIKSIPFFIQLDNDEDEINLVSVNDLSLIVEINGSVKINDIDCHSGYYEIRFKNEFHNAVKYYILESIDEIKNPIINQIAPLFTGLVLHNGESQIMISCDVKYEGESHINFIDSPNNKIDFEINGSSFINDKEFSNGTFRMQIKEDKDNKKINSLVYRVPKSYNVLDKNSNFKVSYPNGKFIFSPMSPEDVFSRININITEDSKLNKLLSQESNKKKSTIFSIDGDAFINGNKICNGFYKILFSERINEEGVKCYEFDSCNKIENPLLNNKQEFIIEDSFYTHHINGRKVVPSFIQTDKKSKISLLKKNNEEAIIHIEEGLVTIDNKTLYETEDKLYKNIWKLTFKDFERDSKVDEYVISKEVLSLAFKSDEKELLKKFDEICDVG